MNDALDPQVQQLIDDIASMKLRLVSLETSLNALQTSLRSPRVQIKNFEGLFKSAATAPTVTDTNWTDGSMLLSDTGVTRKINVRINGVWYSVAVT